MCIHLIFSGKCPFNVLSFTSDQTSRMFLYTISSALLFLFLWKVFFPVPKPILGIYSRAGNRGIFKQIFMFVLMKLRRKKEKSEAGYGVKLTSDITKLESVQVNLTLSSTFIYIYLSFQDLGSSPLAIDAVLFTGGSRDGTYLIISAARRANKIVQCIVMLYVPGLGLMEHSQHPSTSLQQVPCSTNSSLLTPPNLD